ncbi:MAG: hypothetical protein AAB885_00580 [Patescibacteria group bacterium]
MADTVLLIVVASLVTYWVISRWGKDSMDFDGQDDDDDDDNRGDDDGRLRKPKGPKGKKIENREGILL